MSEKKGKKRKVEMSSEKTRGEKRKTTAEAMLLLSMEVTRSKNEIQKKHAKLYVEKVMPKLLDSIEREAKAGKTWHSFILEDEKIPFLPFLCKELRSDPHFFHVHVHSGSILLIYWHNDTHISKILNKS